MGSSGSQIDVLKLAIVIPTLNEEHNLEATLKCINRNRLKEIIVVDGGSTDGTIAIAKANKAKVLRAPTGRGPQLNVGWRASKADWLLFLHADTQLPTDFDVILQQKLQEQCRQQQQQQPAHSQLWQQLLAWQRQQHQQHQRHHQLNQQQLLHPLQQQRQWKQHKHHVPCWGCFQSIRLTQIPHWQSWLVEQGVALRTRLLRLPYGDQAIFVSRQALQDIQGFPDWQILEDVDLVKRLNKLSPPLIMSESVTTSGRRYKALGFWRNIVLNQAIMLGWITGLRQDELQRIHDAVGRETDKLNKRK